MIDLKKKYFSNKTTAKVPKAPSRIKKEMKARERLASPSSLTSPLQGVGTSTVSSLYLLEILTSSQQQQLLLVLIILLSLVLLILVNLSVPSCPWLVQCHQCPREEEMNSKEVVIFVVNVSRNSRHSPNEGYCFFSM